MVEESKIIGNCKYCVCKNGTMIGLRSARLVIEFMRR